MALPLSTETAKASAGCRYRNGYSSSTAGSATPRGTHRGLGTGGVCCSGGSGQLPSLTLRRSLRQTSFEDRARELAGSSTFVPFDLIISNPPFYPEEVVSPDRARRLARHSEAEGLSPETLLTYAPSLLTPRGALTLITPASSLPSLRQCAVESLLRLAELVYVYSVPGRLVRVLTLWCRLRVGEDYIPTHTEHLTLLGKDGASTPAYRALMQPYLLPEYL